MRNELEYDDIKGKNTIYIDSREKNRINKFKDYLKDYLKTHDNLENLRPVCKFKRGKRDNWGSRIFESLNFEVTNLEVGDIAYNNCVVEIKEFSDYHITNGRGDMSKYCNNLSISGFPHHMLIVILSDERVFNEEYNSESSDYLHYYRKDSMWKGGINFGERTNYQIVPNIDYCFKMIIHYFKKWGNNEYMSPPSSRLKNNCNMALNALLGLNVFSEKQCQNIVKKYNINQFNEVFKLNEDNLKELKLNENKINNFIRLRDGLDLI